MTNSDNWKNTLYIWDGIVRAVEDRDDSKSPAPLEWSGNWVAITDVPDARSAEIPKRSGARRDIDDDANEFSVSGTAVPVTGEPSNEVDAFFNQYVVAKLTEGPGWDMKDDSEQAKTYQDETHEVFVKTIRWSGNQKDEREFLLVAKGKNEFGPFCSVGWVRPGCRWTLARRYLDDNDPRTDWSLLELHQAVTKECITEVTVEGSHQKKLMIPPWKTSTMHVSYQNIINNNNADAKDGGGKRQKTREE